ncbi:LytS/YhcK type 5TM receptor domain-containing protein [Clostridium hydrogenum]|uniref:LytS/YhcK type 5TM receptor domain-containing protein n=1 Tax=Clostridium hydrogenum TaxID=2855764 RepID=UPI001F2137CF|nr:LytS/YhcK type 5TM receptor domain-containing protein [Clostridium hydrogenum]
MIYVRLLQNMAVTALAAYLYNQLNLFKNFIKEKQTFKDKIIMFIFFSVLSIIGTYMGINVGGDALANTRPIGAITAGYIGGPIVGAVVGIIAGVHRYFNGGATAIACSISTVLEGVIGGIFRRMAKNNEIKPKDAFVASIIAEIVQMIIIILIAKPYSYAVDLEKIIAIPMIVINSIGTAIFVNIVKNAMDNYNKLGAIQAQKALNIAKKTIEYTKKGINSETSMKISEILCKMANVSGAVISMKDGVFSYYGEKIDENDLKSKINDFYLKSDVNTYSIENQAKNYNFFFAPITINNKIDGVIGMELKDSKSVNEYFGEFLSELSSLLSMQMELFELNEKVTILKDSELKALRAQIEPHFLFNTLNTIASFCRTNPLKARELIIDLSNYFRKSLNKGEFVELDEEIEMLNSYISIEKARYGDRLRVYFYIQKDIGNFKIPSFIIQPIIENSIIHGVLKRADGGKVIVKAEKALDCIKFTIEDNGIGMNIERYNEVVNNWPGTGLRNVNSRLKLLYNSHGLLMSSSEDKGTTVIFKIPMKEVHKVE